MTSNQWGRVCGGREPILAGARLGEGTKTLWATLILNNFHKMENDLRWRVDFACQKRGTNTFQRTKCLGKPNNKRQHCPERSL